MAFIIYTSNFAHAQALRSSHITPVSISLYPPRYFNGHRLNCLAPSRSILDEWHRSHDIRRYVQRYRSEVLAKLCAADVLRMLVELADEGGVALCCFEKAGEFCHRLLVADWLEEHTMMHVEEF